MIVQVETEQISKARLLCHDKLDPGGHHQLFPVSLSNCWVLQLTHCPQRGQHVLHVRLQPPEQIPFPHFLVKPPDILGELLALHIHVLHVDVGPERQFPLLNGRPDQESLVPELLQHLDFFPALLSQGESRYP